MRTPKHPYGLRQLLRSVICLALLLSATASNAEINSVETCRTAIAEDPQVAREDASVWFRNGGGVPARLCEAAALEEMGANATAARILTGMAANPNRAMDAVLRATIFADGARLWLVSGRPDLTLEALRQAETLVVPDSDLIILRARAQAALDDWPAALVTVSPLAEQLPGNADLQALLAATLLENGKLPEAKEAAQRALTIEPALPQGLFQMAKAEAALGNTTEASRLLLQIINTWPNDPIADQARQQLQSLN